MVTLTSILYLISLTVISLNFLSNSLDVFVISEAKLDETFPEGQFLMDRFTAPYRMDRHTNVGGIARYVREDISSRQILFKNNDKDLEHVLLKSTSARKSG